MPLLEVSEYFPFLRDSRALEDGKVFLKPFYSQYVQRVSAADMAVSLRTASFLWAMCVGLEPKSILDLGSGFSSFVFRFYAKSRSTNVWSVDDDPVWLARTRNYLATVDVPTDCLIVWNAFLSTTATFELVFHDLGNMQSRGRTLRHALARTNCHCGVLVLDDVHKEEYQVPMRDALANCRCRYLDAKAFTLDGFGRYCGVVTAISGSRSLNVSGAGA